MRTLPFIRPSPDPRPLTPDPCFSRRLLSIQLLLHLCFDRLDLHTVLLHLKLYVPKNPDVEIRDVYQRKQRNQITAPVVGQQLIAGDDQEPRAHPVAEAVLARKQVEEFAAQQSV